MGPQNIHPYPPPLKSAFWPEMGGGGGGVYNISLENVWCDESFRSKSLAFACVDEITIGVDIWQKPTLQHLGPDLSVRSVSRLLEFRI